MKKYFGELLEKKDYISGTAQKEMLYGHSLHKVGSDCAGKYYNGKLGNSISLFLFIK